MAVPYTFGSATTSIPLSQLDSNFATAITLGNTAVQLGNTITTLTGVTNLASSGSLTLGSNGNTTAITIDTSQNVGIGTSSPAFKLEVVSGTNNGIHIKDAASATVFGGLFTQASAFALVARSNHALTFGTNDTERMRVNAGAPILCLSGGSTTATGTGIAFPATQSASSDANTLDDYEEGTFTPNQGAGLTVVGTFGSSGSYTKVGRLVTVIGLVTGSTSIASSAGGAICSNLPFTCAAGTVGGVADSNGGGGSCLISSTSALSYPAHAGSPGIYFTATYAV
jgi:hypothetical protein